MVCFLLVKKSDDIVKKYKNKNWLGIIMACISPKAYEAVAKDLQQLDIPYGFKLNAFKKIPEGYTVASKDQWGNAGNPTTVLGINTDLNESRFKKIPEGYTVASLMKDQWGNAGKSNYEF